MRLRFRALLFLLAGTFLAKPTIAAEPVVSPAADGIFAAFKEHPIVGLGDVHGLAEEGAFTVRLIRDPRFASEVGIVVMEMASSAHQDTIDRYVNGENIPRAELQKVFSDTFAAIPAVTSVMYTRLLPEVRAVNLKLPPDHRIHVLAGEAPVDMSKVARRDDLAPLIQQRDKFTADVIEHEVLSRGRKALVIYGTAHFFPSPSPTSAGAASPSLKGLIERDHPGAVFVVAPYKGFFQPECSIAFEQKARWPADSLIAPVRGTPLETLLTPPGCTHGPPPRRPPGAPPIPPEIMAKIVAPMERANSGTDAAALLFLGPVSTLHWSADDAELLADPTYAAALKHRFAVLGLPPNVLEPLETGARPFRSGSNVAQGALQ